MKENRYQLNPLTLSWESRADQYPVIINAILHHLHPLDHTHTPEPFDTRISEYLHGSHYKNTNQTDCFLRSSGSN